MKKTLLVLTLILFTSCLFVACNGDVNAVLVSPSSKNEAPIKPSLLIAEVTVSGQKLMAGNEEISIKVNGQVASLTELQLKALAEKLNRLNGSNPIKNFQETDLKESTKINESEGLKAVKEALKKEAQDSKSKNHIDSKSSKEIDLLVSVQMLSVDMSSTETMTIESVDFDVTPIATTTVTDSTGKSVTVSAEITEQLHEPIKFRLPLDNRTTEKDIAIYHEGSYFGNFKVQTDNSEKYVEISSKDFSTYSYILLNENNSEVKIGSTFYFKFEEAVKEVKDSETIVLLKDTGSDTTTVERVVEFTVDKNAKSFNAKLVATSGLIMEKTDKSTTIDYLFVLESSTFNLLLENTSFTIDYNAKGINSYTAATKRGYQLVGWYSEAEGGILVLDKDGVTVKSATGYTNGEGQWIKIVAPESSISLYAHWSPIEMKINYKNQGGKALSGTNDPDAPIKHTFGTVTPLKAPTRTNGTFVAWYTTQDCSGTPLTSLGATDFDDDITLYAKWDVTGSTSTLTLNPNGGSGSPINSSIVQDDCGSDLFTCPTIEGFLLDGWYTENEGGIKVLNADGSCVKGVDDYTNTDGEWIKEGNVSLYAHWIQPLCFEAKTAGATVKIKKTGNPAAVSLVYSTDGTTWMDYTIASGDDGVGPVITLQNVNDKVYFKAATENKTFSQSNSKYYQFVFNDKSVQASGNVMSLLDSSCSLTDISDSGYKYCFAYLFKDNTSLVNAINLPATKLSDYCYYGMFSGCTGFTSISETMLPAMDLAKYCYQNMFKDCTGLETIPAALLPAKTLTEGCYSGMFEGCTTISSIPKDLLPVNTLATNCYKDMFKGCTGLLSIDKDLLPKHNTGVLAEGCFAGMFSNCTGLTEIPTKWLTVESLKKNCYAEMFSGCTGLLSIPEDFFPAVLSLAEGCCSGMFKGCTKLTTLPANLLHSSTMQKACYYEMFADCTGLTTLPADFNKKPTTLAEGCYESMFKGCTGLETVPSNLLPLTTLQASCYAQMFSGCTKLTNAPDLPAETLANYCYQNMFNGCEKLKSISVSFKSTAGATNPVDKWFVNAGSYWINGAGKTENVKPTFKGPALLNTSAIGIIDGWEFTISATSIGDLNLFSHKVETEPGLNVDYKTFGWKENSSNKYCYWIYNRFEVFYGSTSSDYQGKQYHQVSMTTTLTKDGNTLKCTVDGVTIKFHIGNGIIDYLTITGNTNINGTYSNPNVPK